MEIAAVERGKETPLSSNIPRAAISKSCSQVVSLNNGVNVTYPDVASNPSNGSEQKVLPVINHFLLRGLSRLSRNVVLKSVLQRWKLLYSS